MENLYMPKSILKLFKKYQEQNSNPSKTAMKNEKDAIKYELQRRLYNVYFRLDEAKTEDDIIAVYNRFIGE